MLQPLSEIKWRQHQERLPKARAWFVLQLRTEKTKQVCQMQVLPWVEQGLEPTWHPALHVSVLVRAPHSPWKGDELEPPRSPFSSTPLCFFPLLVLLLESGELVAWSLGLSSYSPGFCSLCFKDPSWAPFSCRRNWLSQHLKRGGVLEMNTAWWKDIHYHRLYLSILTILIFLKERLFKIKGVTR